MVVLYSSESGLPLRLVLVKTEAQVCIFFKKRTEQNTVHRCIFFLKKKNHTLPFHELSCNWLHPFGEFL